MEDATRSLQLLQHSRHDWMNRLQVIKGNLELANIDRAKEVIEEIIIEVRQEAQLSSLGVPCVSAWLLTYNWDRKSRLSVNFEILSDGKVSEKMDIPLLTWIKSVVDNLEPYVPADVDNELYLIFHVDQEQSALHVTLEYEGGPLACSPKELLTNVEGPILEWNDSSKESFAVETSFIWLVAKQE